MGYVMLPVMLKIKFDKVRNDGENPSFSSYNNY